jgi:hypothetical protein
MALSAKQKRAARYLGLYMTQVEVARRVVVNVRTIRRWLTDDAEFAALVQCERDAGNDLQPEDVLRDLLLSEDERVRLSAAIHPRKTSAGVGAPAGADDEDADVLAAWS